MRSFDYDSPASCGGVASLNKNAAETKPRGEGIDLLAEIFRGADS